MEHSANYLGLIPLLPLTGALVIGLLHMMTCTGKPLPEKLYSTLACIGPLLSFFMALVVFFHLRDMAPEDRFLSHIAFTWFAIGDLHVDMGFLADPLSALMLIFVSFIGSLIHIYSIGYMAGDENYGKFFAYLNLFLGSMLILVLGNGPVVMFVGWEGVGLCSYLLISFYTKDTDNVLAGNKAFIVNRIGDLGFVLGMSFLFWAIGSGGFDYLSLKENTHLLTPGIGFAVCLLLFVGACGKSAQIPLYVWLPDAMAGPTPVSALIHAATMVTAGVYMVARFSFIYAHVPAAGTIVAWVGILTALLSAIFGMFQKDIKKILAYSTVSQLGYMFAGVGLAAYSAGIFHVFTHAFFKALLFLGAGSVIYALHHQQDIWKMGGLKKKMPTTYATMLIGALALAGCPPFSGFFSKDEILFSALASGHPGIWFIGVTVAGMTAYYTFRMIFLVFHGKPRDQEAYDHAHEPPPVMTVPLIILAAGAAFAGVLNLPGIFGGHMSVSHWLAPSLVEHHPHASVWVELFAMLASIAAVVVGITIAYKKFSQGAEEPVFTGFAKFGYHKFYVDEIYNAVFVQPYKAIGSLISRIFEPNVTDIHVKLSTWIYKKCGKGFKVLQVGYVRVYAIYMVIGLSLMSFFLSQSIN
ncbi:NADH-quinone oxidoreductase subunit L [Desulforhopalus sp. IMCC35007]|uniref:NADH-quinone oxidoreductase subunit L n=1 Tax=Desulforhopalus sp. IMCC35007 TaxID=2569543 RepID=UPI0010AE42FF|nr:NADH-quinone oxidoreductase subunit L [Desulforhopalus sp. IMCC35007]TKB05788.1 NADH-quinone oxidoreductase subunit L [Desulforhopalus sp. IMCC35007]